MFCFVFEKKKKTTIIGEYLLQLRCNQPILMCYNKNLLSLFCWGSVHCFSCNTHNTFLLKCLIVSLVELLWHKLEHGFTVYYTVVFYIQYKIPQLKRANSCCTNNEYGLGESTENSQHTVNTIFACLIFWRTQHTLAISTVIKAYFFSDSLCQSPPTPPQEKNIIASCGLLEIKSLLI